MLAPWGRIRKVEGGLEAKVFRCGTRLGGIGLANKRGWACRGEARKIFRMSVGTSCDNRTWGLLNSRIFSDVSDKDDIVYTFGRHFLSPAIEYGICTTIHRPLTLIKAYLDDAKTKSRSVSLSRERSSALQEVLCARP